MSFRALVCEAEGVAPGMRTVDEAALPPGDVTVAVAWSGLNYKDAMVLKGLGRLVRRYPHIGGIDLAGHVIASESPDYRVGDAVILTGWRVGEIHWGGYGETARVKAEWLLPLPDGLSLRQSMALGTAGLTAMLALLALEEAGLTPDTAGELLVTGASGGLGGVAVALAARCGYRVTASTGRLDEAPRLKALGAADVIDRAVLSVPERPLLAERWGGCIDSVGGETLAHALAALRLHGAVASCGNAGGVALKTTVLPFLLRGVKLLGIDSAQCPVPLRRRAWARLAQHLPPAVIDSFVMEIGLEELPAAAERILAGQVCGRLVVRVRGE